MKYKRLQAEQLGKLKDIQNTSTFSDFKRMIRGPERIMMKHISAFTKKSLLHNYRRIKNKAKSDKQRDGRKLLSLLEFRAAKFSGALGVRERSGSSTLHRQWTTRGDTALLRTIFLVMLLALLPVAGGADEPATRYFPADAWGKPVGTQTQAKESRYYEKRFGGHLAAMKEPSLAFADGSDRGPNEIRLLFLPSFDPGSMLRISYSDKQEVSFEFKKLSGAGGSTPGDLRVHSTGTVDEGDADRIFALLDAIDPWSEAIPPVFARSLCMDGTRTVLEFRKRDAYKVIQRHGCDLVPDDDIRKLIHVLNDVSDGQMIAPHTFEPADWMKGFDREDLKDYWDRLEKDRRDRRERNLRIRMGYPD